ncbi:hypothetical protein BD410DRAFT_780983 [Rickenella mellea]|uniref:Uncharacterized protein n=1 Tax=Rickenella mellea TaxID=50990 RepID=A0A4Y7QLI0_9AGAM|nr:hypothetical protein BD410DRAFT_780983 [Rickenella mellea]
MTSVVSNNHHWHLLVDLDARSWAQLTCTTDMNDVLTPHSYTVVLLLPEILLTFWLQVRNDV